MLTPKERAQLLRLRQKEGEPVKPLTDERRAMLAGVLADMEVLNE